MRLATFKTNGTVSLKLEITRGDKDMTIFCLFLMAVAPGLNLRQTLVDCLSAGKAGKPDVTLVTTDTLTVKTGAERGTIWVTGNNEADVAKARSLLLEMKG